MTPFRFAFLLATLLLPAAALAQTSKTMQIIAPGASADGIGRIMGTEFGSRLGRQIAAENKPGADGALGLVTVAKATPDGDTLAALVIAPHGWRRCSRSV
jgi:tripartite-type tricarboxylate transporter receptor subunit TctC